MVATFPCGWLPAAGAPLCPAMYPAAEPDPDPQPVVPASARAASIAAVVVRDPVTGRKKIAVVDVGES